MKADIDFAADVKIDPSALDIEWMEQTELALKYVKLSAKARKEMDQAKEELEIIRAEIQQDIEKNPKAYGLSRVTKDSIESVIILEDDYRKAMNTYIEAKYAANILQEGCREICARKDALANLVRLHGMNYFSGPSLPRDLPNEWANHNKQKQVDKKTMFRSRKRERN